MLILDCKVILEGFESKVELFRILTSVGKFPPAGGIAQSSIVDLAGGICKANGPGVVGESDGAVEFHEGDIVVEQGVIIVRMEDDLGHCAVHFVSIRPTLGLSSKVDSPG